MLVFKIPAFAVGVICLFLGAFQGVFPNVITAKINWLCLGLGFIALSTIL